MTTAHQRSELARIMDELVHNNARIHYAQIRPMVTVRHIHNLGQLKMELGTRTGFAMDCSESVTLLCKLAGLKDPNGLGYDGAGNTQVMYDHLTHYENPAGANIGALVFFGIPGQLRTQHICMVRGRGHDPLLFSHGQEAGPFYIRLFEERKYHRGTPVFLNVSHL